MCQTRGTEKERLSRVLTAFRQSSRTREIVSVALEIYVRVQSCLRTVCVPDSVHTRSERKREIAQSELSSSVSHTAGHDDPKRKFHSSRAAAWRLNDQWRMCVIARYACYVFKWPLHIPFNYSFCRVTTNGCCYSNAREYRYNYFFFNNISSAIFLSYVYIKIYKYYKYIIKNIDKWL